MDAMTPSAAALPAGPARKRRLRLAPGERRQQIVSAAIAYFSEVGFDGGTRELAKRLGVTQPLIYRYFPSKDDLIRTVYNELYLDRWRPEWKALLTDQAQPLRQRLITFYGRYTDAVFTPEWMRIYLFAGLRGVEINPWWINFVEDHLLRTMAIAMRAAHGLPDDAAMPITPQELDLYWIFHGGIFYYGMRREVYRTPVHLDLAAFIINSVDSMLHGLPFALRRLLQDQAS
jgi:AcrR family transcriptional regulator